MRFYPVFGVLAALAAMAVVWLTILYQLDGQMGFFTWVLVIGSFGYVVWSVVYKAVLYR